MKLLLFDIDGTLLLSGGAGLRGMNRAFEKMYGIADILNGITLSGRTDDKIIMDAYAKAGRAFSYSELAKFKALYFQFIEQEMRVDGPRKRTMPGVATLLPELAARENVYMGLLTGNWEKSGRAKLDHFGLNKYFDFGAFSDDSSDRNELAPIAINRFTAQHALAPAADQIYIIGDTPADIHCAKPHGVVSVAVAAAGHSVEELKPHDPDYLFEDLTATHKILKILG